MGILVQKYGGSSVADAARMGRVADRVAAARRAGHAVVVVVSAMGDTTDELLELARSVSENPPRRELDMLLTCGERISMALLSMALAKEGVEAISFTGSQSGIITDESHAQARIVEVRPARIEAALAEGKVVIVAGYQGVSRAKEITTLGRGGSDTSAVALAAALNADCEIYSDVAGVFSADPRVVADASRLESLSYDEMQAFAASGAKVLNAQAVEFAKSKGITVQALSTFQPGPGTRIVPGASMDGAVRGVASATDVVVLHAPIAAAGVFEALERAHARVQNAWLSDGRWTLVLPVENVHGLAALRSELTALGASWNDGLASVSCVGHGVGTGALASRMLEALRSQHLVCADAHTTAHSVSVLVEKASAPQVVQAFHRQFVPARVA